jgi:hypothetical protein
MVTFRVESASRWDALALAGKLARYRWYIVEPDASHWNVCVHVDQPSQQLPEGLRRTIAAWLRERGLDNTIIHVGSDDYLIAR